VLGPGVILGDRQGYRLADSAEVCVDLDAAARYCGQAERKIATSPAIALAAAEQAIGLLAGDVALADEPYSSWADPARGELRGLLRRAGLAAAEAALATGEAVTAFLTRLTERAPVLLVVDDLQYAGQSTSEFIHYLGRHAQGSRLLVVATIRAEHDRQAGAALASVATRVEVGPLGAAAVEQLAREAGQGALAGPILQRTRGHTLFVVEVLRALADGDLGVPESLRSAVQARVRQAGPVTETLLRAASVLGAAIDPLTLGELLQLTPAVAVERCEQALQARLLVVSGRDYEFANDLIREVLYATTPEPTRLAYHRRAADLLARLTVIAGTRLRLDAALEYARRAVIAGRAAADEHALAVGLDSLKTACLNIGDATGLAAVLAELTPLLRRLDDLTRLQWAELDTGLAAAEAGGGEANLLRCAAPLAEATGSPAVLADADRLLAQASIPAGGAWVYGDDACMSLARAWLGRGHPERARTVLAPLLAVAERVPWTATLAATLATDGRALLRMGQHQQARIQLLRAEDLALKHGLPHVLQEARSSRATLG